MKLNIDNVVDEILQGKEVENIIGLPNEFPVELIEQISLKTALRYWNGEIDFYEGDKIMNKIYGYWVFTDNYVENFNFSEIAWDCYEAFDSGEYKREIDEASIDPIEKYTKPSIEKLLRKQKLIK